MTDTGCTHTHTAYMYLDSANCHDSLAPISDNSPVGTPGDCDLPVSDLNMNKFNIEGNIFVLNPI